MNVLRGNKTLTLKHVKKKYVFEPKIPKLVVKHLSHATAVLRKYISIGRKFKAEEIVTKVCMEFNTSLLYFFTSLTILMEC